MATAVGDSLSGRATGSQAPDGARSHRLLLANLDRYADSSSDQDDTSDDDTASQTYLKDDDDPDQLVGVSMGRAQTRLKSARTPAYEKAMALEESGHYFATEPEQIEQDDKDDDDDNDPGHVEPREVANDTGLALGSGDEPRITLSADDALPAQKSSTTSQWASMSKVFGSQGAIKTRRRASSGPTALINSIKKILPDLSSPLGSRFGSTSPTSLAAEPTTSQRESSGPSSIYLQTKADSSSKDMYERSPLSTVTNDSQQPKPASGTTELTSTDAKGATRPPLRSRTTSDNSLYLRRAITGGSDFDDTTIYANVADMPNARFKAITDSLQDSAIRLPKFPGAILGAARTSLSGPDSNITKQNTEANRGVPRSATIDLGPHGQISSSLPSPLRKESKHPILKEALGRATGDMVVLGGYRGSVLRSAEPPHHQVWIPVKVGLNLRKVDLEVGLDHEDEERMTERIIPSGILSHIGPIDISRRLLGKIRRCHNVKTNQLRLHDWGYDWRLSPHFLAKQLITFLESLDCNKQETPPNERGALVVAHSLGGLITRHAVNQRPELFKGVVYAGVPQNCVNILGPLRNGDDVLISSRVLTAQVNFTLRTSYALLPEDGRCFINRETGERYDFDFFDIKTWDEYRLSPCINPPLAPLIPVRRKTLVGSISESISSFTPSLPTKKSSWLSFGNGSNSSVTSGTVEPQHQSHGVQEKATAVKDEIGDAVKSTIEKLPTSPQGVVNSTLEPSMKPSSASSPFSSRLSSTICRNRGVDEASGNSSEPALSPSISASSSTATTTTTMNTTATTTPPTSATPTPTSSWSWNTTTTTTATSSKPAQTIATNVTIPAAKAQEYLRRTLGEVKAFKSELAHQPTHESSNVYPPLAIIYGRGVPTVYGAKVASKEAIKYTDAYDDLAFASGDGVVLASAAQLPAGYRCVRAGRILSDRGHVGLLGDLEGIGRCIAAVLEGRRRGIGLGLGL